MPSIIRKRKTKTGEPRFQVRVSYTDPVTGKRDTAIRTFKLRREAVAFQRQVEDERDSGGVVVESTQPVMDYFRDWMETVRATRRENTALSYGAMIDTYIVPIIGGLSLVALTPKRIQSLLDGMTARGLAPRTVRYTHSVLHVALGKAVSLRMLRFNPASALDLPAERRKEILVMTENEVRGFLAAAKGNRLEAFFRLGFTTGARPAEMLGLMWGHVDPENRLVRIEQTLVRDEQGWYIRDPKTARGRRTVSITTATVTSLRQHRAHQGRQRLKAGHGWQDHGLVFSTEQGEPLSLINIRRREMKNILKSADLNPKYTPYTMRHTHVTALLRRGTPLHEVSRRVGHARASMTLDRYAHYLPGDDERAMEAIAEALDQ